MEATISNSIGMQFIAVQAGRFERNDSNAESKRQTIIVKTPFYLGVTPVTRSQYRKVMEEDPTPKNQLSPNDNDWPIVNVTYFDAIAFCKKLTQIEQSEGKKVNYRLPSELEWEYALTLGATSADFTDVEWRELEVEEIITYNSYQRPVAQHKANGLGIYDMIGWVQQLCDDRYTSNEILAQASDCRPRISWLQSCWSSINSIYQDQKNHRAISEERKGKAKQKGIGRVEANARKNQPQPDSASGDMDSNSVETHADNERKDESILMSSLGHILSVLPMMIYYGPPRVTRGFGSNQIRGWVLPNIRTDYNGFRVALETK